MSDPAKTLICRPVYGFSLYAVWSNAEPSKIVRYEIALPSTAILPFRGDALAAALKTFHISTDVLLWFAAPYELYPVFRGGDSNEVLHYVIFGPGQAVFESGPLPGGLLEALTVFELLTGVDIMDDHAMVDHPDWIGI